jgi:hypothetical protein
MAEAQLPPGTILPVSLDRGIDARKAHSGQRIQAEVMQDLPGSEVKRRAQVLGRILSVTGPESNSAALTFQFDAIQEHGKKIPLAASLRAVASWIEVQEAQTPEQSMDRGITPESATTTQIGGEQVYRGGGPVAAGIETVGTPVPYGVLGRPRPNMGSGCRGVLGGDRPQAFWLFSTDACGVYGFPHLHILHAGRTRLLGTIVVRSDSDRLNLPAGTGLLLRVLPPQ